MTSEPEDLGPALAPLLKALDYLAMFARHADPFDLAPALEALAPVGAALHEARPAIEAWADGPPGARARLADAADLVLVAYDALATAQPGDMLAAFRAVSQTPLALETLYPLAASLPAVSRFFLHPDKRADEALLASLAAPPAQDAQVGLLHGGGEPGERAAWSAYVPEYYAEDRAWPLVMALHGGRGDGRSFLWSWLKDARSFGAIVIAPTSADETWSLRGPDLDTERLTALVDDARGRWNIDPHRLLLTGLSDGGTFSWVSGLQPDSIFTHLAPACASYRPAYAFSADRERIAGLPIHITHGVHDPMFSVGMAQEARFVFAQAGANVTYREVKNLGHAYPQEYNASILSWMTATRRPPDR